MHAVKVIIRGEGAAVIVPDPARLFVVSGVKLSARPQCDTRKAEAIGR